MRLAAAMSIVCEQCSGKNLESPIRKAFRSMQNIQKSVRGSEAEKDNLIPKFTALRLWSGCSSLFLRWTPTISAVL